MFWVATLLSLTALFLALMAGGTYGRGYRREGNMLLTVAGGLAVLVALMLWVSRM